MATQIRFGLLQDAVRVKNSGGTLIDPATEQTLLLLLAKIDVAVVGEVPTGPVDGSNRAFGSAHAFRPGSLRFYVNGVRQREGVGHDYTEDLDHLGVTMSYSPLGGDHLLMDYTKL